MYLLSFDLYVFFRVLLYKIESVAAPAGGACVSRSPPLALKMTGDLDKEDRRVGGRGGDLGGAYSMGRRDRRATTRGGVICQPFPSYLRQDRSHAGASAGRHPGSVGAGRAS
jgi:hypothetical protein